MAHMMPYWKARVKLGHTKTFQILPKRRRSAIFLAVLKKQVDLLGFVHNYVAMLNTSSNLGAFVRRLREQRDLTTRQLAAKIGMSHTSLAARERGAIRFHLSELPKIAAALGVEVHELEVVGGETTYSPDPTQNRANVESESPPLESTTEEGNYIMVGDSMIPTISPGDRLAIKRFYFGDVPAIGEIVGVQFSGDDLKTSVEIYQWFPLGVGRVRLSKANPRAHSIEVEISQIARLYKVLRIVRRSA